MSLLLSGMSLLLLILSGNQSICQFLVAGLPGYRGLVCGHVGMSLSCLSDVIIAFGSLGFFMRLMIACEMLAKDWLGFSCYCLQCPHMWMNKTAPGHARLVQYGVGVGC